MLIRSVGGLPRSSGSIFFFRALGGLGQNLKSVGARGNFQTLVPELLALPEVTTSQPTTSA